MAGGTSDSLAWKGSSGGNLLEELSLTLTIHPVPPQSQNMVGWRRPTAHSTNLPPPKRGGGRKLLPLSCDKTSSVTSSTLPSWPQAEGLTQPGHRRCSAHIGGLEKAGPGCRRWHPTPWASSPFPKKSSSCCPGSCISLGISGERTNGSGDSGELCTQ